MVYVWRYRCVLGATEIVSEIIQCKQIISKINEAMEGRETRLIEEMRKSSHSSGSLECCWKNGCRGGISAKGD